MDGAGGTGALGEMSGATASPAACSSASPAACSSAGELPRISWQASDVLLDHLRPARLGKITVQGANPPITELRSSALDR